MLVQEPVHAAIWHCLNHYAYGDATFLAERLFYEVHSDESLHLLATCYYRSGKLGQAYDVLQTNGVRTPSNKFLLAKCCNQLNKLAEAEVAILGEDVNPVKPDLECLKSTFGEIAGFALQLLASIYEGTERNLRAKEADLAALEVNPFLWKSFEGLCDRGEVINPAKYFNVDNLASLAGCVGSNPVLSYANGLQSFPAPSKGSTVTSTPVLAPQSQNLQATAPPTHPPSSAAPPVLMTTMLTPVNQLCFDSADGAWSENSAVSGVGLLNFTDNELSGEPVVSTPNQSGTPLVTPSPQQRSGTMPPPPPRRQTVGRRFCDRSNKTPGHNYLFRRILVNNTTNSSNVSFGHLPRGPLKWNSQDKSILSVSDNAENLVTSETKSKRGLGESNALKSNIFSQNITPTPTSNNSGVQSVRRSSRLFGSSQQSGSKENTKGLKNRKSKGKFSKAAELVERNERNREEVVVNNNNPSITITDCGQQLSHIHGEQTQKMLQEQALIIQKSSVKGLMDLLRLLGSAYAELSRFNGKKAIRLLDEVPAHQKNTGWVLGLMGKSYFELGEYREAKKFFGEMRDRDPHRLDLTEYYSTALWHLQEEFELSYLAQELLRVDKLSAQSWCAAGNCFSHQKEHENAIKFFQRAVQVDPGFSYAYTLLGHEYVMIEELDKALSCFRNAVKVDRRHYNAWYGIGLTYYKQERFSLAEIYYRKALAINPQSPVLMCHVAVVQHALQKSEKALETLNSAISMSPKNPLCKFERASILFATERYQEALGELDELKVLVPKESPVYFLIGKVHNKLGNTHLALMHFSWAMDLDPKGANSQIKDALDPALNRVNQEEVSVVEPNGGQQEDAVEDGEEEEATNTSPGFRSSSPLEPNQALAAPTSSAGPSPDQPPVQDDSL